MTSWARAKWGLGRKVVQQIYKGAVEPIVGVWLKCARIWPNPPERKTTFYGSEHPDNSSKCSLLCRLHFQLFSRMFRGELIAIYILDEEAL